MKADAITHIRQRLTVGEARRYRDEHGCGLQDAVRILTLRELRACAAEAKSLDDMRVVVLALIDFVGEKH